MLSQPILLAISTGVLSAVATLLVLAMILAGVCAIIYRHARLNIGSLERSPTATDLTAIQTGFTVKDISKSSVSVFDDFTNTWKVFHSSGFSNSKVAAHLTSTSVLLNLTQEDMRNASDSEGEYLTLVLRSLGRGPNPQATNHRSTSPPEHSSHGSDQAVVAPSATPQNMRKKMNKSQCRLCLAARQTISAILRRKKSNSADGGASSEGAKPC